MSETKRLLNMVKANSLGRSVSEIVGVRSGDFTSEPYSKFVPDSQIILSVLNSGSTPVEPEFKTDSEKGDGDKKQTNQTSKASNLISMKVCLSLPDGNICTIGEISIDGPGVAMYDVASLPTGWFLSIATKSKLAYTVYAY